MNRQDGELHQPDIIFESRVLAKDRVDYALKAGLAKNRTKLDLYKRVCASPNRFAQEPLLRPYGQELLDTVLHLVFTDPVMWNRLKTLLTRNRARGLREEISDSGLRSLIDKSVQREVPLEVVLEVYSRGARGGGEREGFTRVDSFLAGGRARTMDSDLIVEEIREVPEQKPNRTLDTLKRVLKEKKR